LRQNKHGRKMQLLQGMMVLVCVSSQDIPNVAMSRQTESPEVLHKKGLEQTAPTIVISDSFLFA